MTKVLSIVEAPATVAGTTRTLLLKPTTYYEMLVVQLTNLGDTAATAVLELKRNGNYYRVSPSALALDTTGENGANLAEVTLPALNPGEELHITPTSTDVTVEIQAITWGRLANRG